MTSRERIDPYADGRALAERVKRSLDKLSDSVTASEWQHLYRLLEEWQLLGVVLLFLEGLEND